MLSISSGINYQQILIKCIKVWERVKQARRPRRSPVISFSIDQNYRRLRSGSLVELIEMDVYIDVCTGGVVEYSGFFVARTANLHRRAGSY
jgi:hypothetical protein